MMWTRRSDIGVKREGARFRDDRGTALVVTLLLLLALFAISAGALLMTGTELQLRTYSERQVNLRQLAELAAEMGLSRVNLDEAALPDTGYSVLETGYVPLDAEGEPIPGVTLNIFAARTGSATGRSGNFASIVGEAVGRGGTAIVRLEVSEESFAKFAYFTDGEGGNIWFAGGDELFGPVHSNDQIKIHSTGATFHDEVTTGATVLYPENGTFLKGYAEGVELIALPDVGDLGRLQALAEAGGTYFETPSTGAPSRVEMRIEFIAIDVNGDGDETDPDEGFFRIYRSDDSNWLGAYGNSSWRETCGDVHTHPVTGESWFISARNHKTLYEGVEQGEDDDEDDEDDEDGRYDGSYYEEVEAWEGVSELKHGVSGWGVVYQRAVSAPSSRCYLGGDPRLSLDSRQLHAWNGSDHESGWLRREMFTSAAVIPEALESRDDAEFLFPLDREYNPAFRGVIYFDGLVGVSGELNGRVTLVSSDNILLLDDFTYSVPANAEQCNDIAGFLSAHDLYVADNNLNTPRQFPGVGGGLRTYDETTSEFIDGVILTMGESFTVENFSGGPSSGEPCEGNDVGRGCLYVTGGLIQKTRGPVGLTSGEGYRKRYAYDSNARFCPPPHFPTTGAYRRNRHYEVNPEVFGDIGLFFAGLR